MELDLFVLGNNVSGVASFLQFLRVVVYHLFEVVFISVCGSVSVCFSNDYSFVGSRRVE